MRRSTWVFLLAILLCLLPPLWPAFQTLYSCVIPRFPTFTGSTTNGLTASANKVAWVFYAPKSGTLNRIGFLLGTVTTGDTLKVSFQDVSTTTGDPDGTADQYRTIVIDSADDNKWIDGSTTPSLGVMTNDGTNGGTKRTVSRGDLLSAVVEFNSFVSGSMNIESQNTAGGTGDFDYRYYVDVFGTTVWAKQTKMGAFALEYDDGSFGYFVGFWPYSVLTTIAYNVNTVAQDEVALRFKLPYTAKVSGACATIDMDGDTDMVLYDDTSTPMATVSMDKDLRRNGATGQPCAWFTSDQTLTKDALYRLSMKPTTATSITLGYFDVSQVGIFDAHDGGQEFYWSDRVDAGTWNNTTTRRPRIYLILSAFDDGTGSGGGASSHTFVARLPKSLRFPVPRLLSPR